jgi:hypothetical protein
MTEKQSLAGQEIAPVTGTAPVADGGMTPDPGFAGGHG